MKSMEVYSGNQSACMNILYEYVLSRLGLTVDSATDRINSKLSRVKDSFAGGKSMF